MRSGTVTSLAVLLASAAAAGTLAVTDRNGRIQALDLKGDSVEVQANIRIPLKGWSRLPGMEQARDVEASTANGQTTWRGTIEVAPGKPFAYEQTLKEEAGAVHLSLEVTAGADAEIEGVFFWLDLPVAAFGGGSCDLVRDGAAVASGPMPAARAPQRHFLSGMADGARMEAPTGKVSLEVAFSRPINVVVQDNREWNTPTYSAFVRFSGDRLAKGETAKLDVRLKLSGQADASPAALTLDASKARYRLDGFGGNYCFNIESPVTHYTLDHLRVAWARTEMTLPEWEPTNDNASPDETNWAFLEAHDQPDTNLRREFLLAQRIQRKGIPYSITIWHLPEWLYEHPRADDERPNRRRVGPDKWPELLESIGSYLAYAKRKYGVEPDLFSFNEPGIGCRVLFTAEEHRDAIKRIGAHMEKLGLKTKMLLGDVTSFRRHLGYPEAAAADPEAMRHVGALAFHSWGGGSPADYAAWADLADRLKLPLLVAELGVDGGAWRGHAYDTFAYALREVRMYQDIVLYARPRGTMQWEFTADYGTVHVEGGKLVPTPRFWFVKHFCNLTPPNAEVLATTSDNPKVLFTAFRGDGPVYTLHIANFGAARPAAITGLPAEVKSLRAFQTGEADAMRELPPIAVEGGVARTPLAPQSLLTLTTLPAP